LKKEAEEREIKLKREGARIIREREGESERNKEGVSGG
jgi:hypothetical protein